MTLRWRQTKTMFRLLSVGTALLLLPASLGIFGSEPTIGSTPASAARADYATKSTPVSFAGPLPALGDTVSATDARQASEVDPTDIALAYDRLIGQPEIFDLLPAAGVTGDVTARKAAVWSLGFDAPEEEASADPAREDGLDQCLPEDARCRAFVTGDGPKKGRFVGRLPDGTEVEISRFQAWRQMRCLAYAAWAEARSEGTEGMLAVMQLILNRVGHDDHPDTVCGVVSEPRQFEAMLNAKSRPWLKAARNRDEMVPAMPDDLTGPNAEAGQAALTLAWRLMTGQIETDLVEGATFYATVALIEKRGSDALAPNLEATTVVGDHAFFRPVDEDDPDGAGTLVAQR